VKPSTSFTQQQTMLHCPRRFFYRYKADRNSDLAGLTNLMSVRELGGHAIHSVLANAVRRIAGGDRISDQTDVIREALGLFNFAVRQSAAVRPGILTGELQLAETFNGQNCAESIAHWRDIIPVAMENGIRMMHYFSFRTDRDGYRLEAEKRATYRHRGREHHFVMDVIISDANTTVIDWKTHEISEKDKGQVKTYQRFLLRTRNLSPTRLYGFAVDLLRGREEACHYRPIDDAFGPRGGHTPGGIYRPVISILPTGPQTETDHYPAKPSAEGCGICPFASICPASFLTPPQPEVTCGI